MVAIAAPPAPFAVDISAQGAPRLKPSCQSANGVAAPGVRFRDFLAELPGHSAAASICETDLTAPMQELAKQLSTALSGSCLYGLLLDASQTPGLQPDCKVTQVTGSTRIAVPACSGGAQPCFDLVADAAVCPYSPGQLRVVVRRPGAPPTGTRYLVECFRP